MKIETVPTYLPRGLEWRWTPYYGAGGLLLTLAAAVASQLRETSPVISVAWACAALMVFALGFRGRANHLQALLMAQLARETEANRLALVGMTTAAFAHELKNAVTVLQGFAELARRVASEESASDRVRNHLAEVESQAGRLAIDLESFLSLTGEDATRNTQPLADAVRDVSRLLSPVAQIREILLETEIGEDLLRPVRSPGFRRALLNLGLNAVHHARSRVRVVARTEDGATVVSVEDDGPGVPPKQEALLFTPLSPGRPGGTGLGLVQVRQALEQEGGTATHEAVTPSGARFVLRLPSAVPHTDAPALTG